MPPVSVAVPVMVTRSPLPTAAPLAGDVTADTGLAASADALEPINPDCMLPGWAPMSANRFTVACCKARLGGADPRSWLPSSPHAYCTVPAPKTSAPLS